MAECSLIAFGDDRRILRRMECDGIRDAVSQVELRMGQLEERMDRRSMLR